MEFTRDIFPGFTTRAPGSYATRPGYHRPSATARRTSGRRITFKSPSPSPTRRTSKKRTPRSQILHHTSKGFRRLNTKRIKNQYARDVAEFVEALSPILIAGLSFYLYNIYEPKHTPSVDV
jgi:hypothetical protein